ncbi:MAG: 3-hydroxyacyl-CoA dehydrogenase NAD-binding domain-containing protein [Verrucomicrobiota bacterium]
MNIQLQFDTDHVATLTFDRTGSAANVFDRPTLKELDGHLAALESHTGLRGVILISAKEKIFIAGADLHSFVSSPDPDALAGIIDLGHRVFTRLSRLPVPTVAAIHGACLGGGCELALACDWRVATDGKPTKIGLPETQLGILPAWGGSIRLPRLIGLPAALGLILAGKQLAAAQAHKLGLIDDIAHPEYLADVARTLLKRGKRPPAPFRPLHLPGLRDLVAAKARRDVLVKTRGHYPAPLKALEVCTAALGKSIDTALALEKAAFLELIRTPECASLLNIFFQQDRAKKLSVPAGTPRPVRKVAVVGAGVMGAGIAQWTSARGLPVILRDVAPDALARGLRTIEGVYREATKRRIFTPAEATAGMDRIMPSDTPVPLGDVDLVVEAAVEKLDAKRAIFADLEGRVRTGTVLATNTSALSIDAIAEGLAHPERVIGLHFFNPVHRMQLVEIVRGPRTSDDTLATTVTFAHRLGKLPVIVKDSPGFLVNRVLMPGLVEAVRLVAAGHSIAAIDQALLDFGLPMGPLRLADEVGLDVALHVATDLANRLPHLDAPDPLLARLVESGDLGKKSGRGFYDHHSGRPVNLGLPPPRPVDYVDRIILVQVNEAARCLAGQVVASADDLDFAMILGTGWAPFRGGPLRHADSLGLPEIVRRLEALAVSDDAHFAPCDHLKTLKHFYPASS